MINTEFDKEIDNLNRTAKLFLDRGDAGTFAESHRLLQAYRLHAAYRADSVAMQTALLTFINTSTRFALGGITVGGNLDVALRVPLPGFRSLAEAVIAFGGVPTSQRPDSPLVIFGEENRHDPARAVKIVASGWAGGIAPAHMPIPMPSKPITTAAAVLAGALAAAEGFALLAGDSLLAGRRLSGLSLWEPARIDDWLSEEATGPTITALPNDFWVLGLGHLGQAFLWTILLSPYRNAADVRVVLQDFDTVTGSTISTSILSKEAMIGEMKTRVMSSILEERGIRTSIVERRFDGSLVRLPDDPAVLVCCVDNAAARSAIEQPKFPMVIESGIGRTEHDFRALRIHTFPAGRKANSIWARGSGSAPNAVSVAYKTLQSQGLDQCGLARLADTAVGSPFVGAAAGALMYAELLRVLHGRPAHAVLDLDLRGHFGIR